MIASLPNGIGTEVHRWVQVQRGLGRRAHPALGWEMIRAYLDYALPVLAGGARASNPCERSPAPTSTTRSLSSAATLPWHGAPGCEASSERSNKNGSSSTTQPEERGRSLAGAPSVDLLGQLDDDPLRAADVAEPIAVFVALHLANELRAAGSQASDDMSTSSTANATWRMPGVFASACRSPPRPDGA